MSPSLAAALGVPKPGPGSAVCGKKLRVTNALNGKSVDVTVLDLRGDEHGLDAQAEAFNRIDDGTGVKTGKLENLQVQFV
jgi:rare lipoprotein A (peptidoglycan hydrolase)